MVRKFDFVFKYNEKLMKDFRRGAIQFEFFKDSFGSYVGNIFGLGIVHGGRKMKKLWIYFARSTCGHL